MARRASTQALSFFNRSSELAELNTLLRARPGAGRIVVVVGPKDSGKSALLTEFIRKQADGEYPGTSCIADLRRVASLTRNNVARLLKSTFLDSLHFKKIKGSLSGGDVKAELEAELEKADDSMDKLFDAIWAFGRWRGALWSGYRDVYPTVFVDEANLLHTWSRSATGMESLRQLMEFFLVATKQTGIMNVVLASSENFFVQWIESFFGAQRTTVLNIGDLCEEDARGYFAKLSAPGEVSDEVWRDMFHYLGGRIGLLAQVAGLTDGWEARKGALLAGCRRALWAGLHPDSILSKKLSPPLWTKDDWVTTMKALLEHEHGIMQFSHLCDKISVPKVRSLMEYDLLHYRPYSAGGNDISLPASTFPLVMPPSRLYLRSMEGLIADLGP